LDYIAKLLFEMRTEAGANQSSGQRPARSKAFKKRLMRLTKVFSFSNAALSTYRAIACLRFPQPFFE